ncbi:FAD-dependent oxidoreductase [Candidatus Omnitrophota bacterium]
MKLIIIGGVAGGAAAAARARRLNEKAEIILFERGEYISFANCGLPYYAGDIIQKRDALLVATPEKFKSWFNVDVRLSHEVCDIDTKLKKICARDIKNNSEYDESYDYIVLSPGAEPIVPPFQGADLPCVYTLRNIPDIDVIKEQLDSGRVKKAVVIGGGFIGLEMAENIKTRGIDVAIIERLAQVMIPYDKEMAVMLHQELAGEGITLYLNEEVTAIKSENKQTLLLTKSGKEISADMIIMSVGVQPEIELAQKAGLTFGKRGIAVNQHMQTSDPSIFAVGDAVETRNVITGTMWHVPLAGPAAKQARVAVNTIFNIKDTYKGTLGTSIVKVCSLTAGMTGASEKVLTTADIAFEKIYTVSMNHAGYYPGASRMIIKTLFDPTSGVVLGGQIIGKEGVDKRIDIIAIAVKQKMAVHDLAQLELAYAPPYGSAKDPINIIGMAASNHLQSLSPLIQWDALTGDEFLLDIRTHGEVDKGSVPDSIHIPLHELRERLSEIPKEKKIAIFCAVGFRGHIANRILLENGYTSYNISGGYVMYRNYKEAETI